MKIKLKNKIAISMITLTLILSGCSSAEITNKTPSNSSTSEITDKYSDRDLDSTWNEKTATKVTLSGTAISISGDGAKADGNNLVISKEGTYVLTGTLYNGKIIVQAKDTEKVQIVLNNANITNEKDTAIEIKTADKVFLTLADNTTNNITDGTTYSDASKSNTSTESTEATEATNTNTTNESSSSTKLDSTANDDTPDSAIYSKADLTINGKGKLNVKAQYKDGIKSKDELTITGGNISIESKEDAITSKDSIAIKDGEFKIIAGKDGLKSSNSTDKTKGWISIDGGNFNIKAENDGIEAETVLEINGGKFDITTGDGSESASNSNFEIRNNKFQIESGNDNNLDSITHPSNQDSSSNSRDKMSQPSKQMLQNRNNITPPSDQFSSNDGQNSDDNATTDNNESKKTLKSGTELNINGGTIDLNSEEDTIHSNKNISISGGTITSNAGDDGLHAEETITIKNNPVVTVKNSYEGVEAKEINIQGGVTSVTSSDDGLNGTSGSTNSLGRGGDSPQSDVTVNISSGILSIDSEGDGIDSNADLNVTGGQTIVYGPTRGGNGSLDYNGDANISKGTLVAIGTADMYQGFDESSSQNSITFAFNSTQNPGENLSLVDSNNNIVVSLTTKKNYQVALMSSEKILKGQTYYLYRGGTTNQTDSNLSVGGKISDGEKIAEVKVSNTNSVVNVG